MKTAIAIIFSLVVLPTAAHDLTVSLDEGEVRAKALESVVVEPLRLRIVIEPRAECSELLARFTGAMKKYVANDRWTHVVPVMNIAQEAVNKGCWR